MKKWNRPCLTRINTAELKSLVAANARSICQRFFVR